MIEKDGDEWIATIFSGDHRVDDDHKIQLVGLFVAHKMNIENIYTHR